MHMQVNATGLDLNPAEFNYELYIKGTLLQDNGGSSSAYVRVAAIPVSGSSNDFISAPIDHTVNAPFEFTGNVPNTALNSLRFSVSSGSAGMKFKYTHIVLTCVSPKE
jgi:hypothetical protein